MRYEIQDDFLRFWFNYFDRHRSMIEIKNFVGLQSIVKADYPVYSGVMLERYFKQQFAESFQYRAIGSWWEPRGEQNEIDIVALKLERNQAVVAEVKPRFRSSSCTTTKCCFTSISIPHSAYTRYASIRISCLFCSIPFRLHSYCGIWVKRQKKNFRPDLLAKKVEHLKNKLLPKFEIEVRCLSLEDM